MAPLQFLHPDRAVWLLLLPCIYILYRAARVPTPRWALGLRVLTVSLLVVSLGGVQIPGERQGSAVVFVLDHSDSVSYADREVARVYLNRATAGMAQHDQAAVVVFGKQAFIEQSFESAVRLATVQTTPTGTRTDIAQAMRLAMRMLESQASKRIVLLSDGNQNAGDAVREARIAATRGITVDVLPLGSLESPHGPDVRLQEMIAPSQVRIGEPFEVTVTVHGSAHTRVVLTLYHNDMPVAQRQESLTPPGRKTVRFSQRLDASGFHRYTSGLESGDERSVVNSAGGVVVYASGKPRVLYIMETPAPHRLIDILTRHDFVVDPVSPSAVPASLQGLSPYDVVIVGNVPAEALGERRMQALADDVEHFGAGLIMTGGTKSFGPGGYAQTALERVLPVDMRVSAREKRSTVALVLLLDKSGSMAAKQGGREKITVAKEAALALQNLLSPHDTLGIIAFDRRARVLLPLTPIGQRLPMNEPVGELQARGGTELYPALDLAYQWLQRAGTDKKQVLLISDGHTAPADFSPLLGKLEAARIALSVVGVGPDAHRAFLTELATRGNGRTYFSEDMSALPGILQREAGRVAGQWVQQRRIKPRVAGQHEIFTGIDISAIPEIDGYIASTRKSLASVLLASERHDPLLAAWRFGLGKTLVLTSDLSSDWTVNLTAWEAFNRLWVQMVRWVSRRAESGRLHPRVTVDGDTATLTVDVFETDGRFLNFLDVQAAIHTPDAQQHRIRLRQIASGTYQGQFPVVRAGAFLLHVSASGEPGQPEDTLHTGVYLAPLAEQRTSRANLSLLRDIARITNGSLLTGEASPFQAEAPDTVYVDAWQVAAFAALLLFMLEVALCRGVIPRPPSRLLRIP